MRKWVSQPRANQQRAKNEMSLQQEIDQTVQKLIRLLNKLEQEKEREKREAECLKEYGKHLDDGGMFNGTCIRCGAFLG